MESTMMLLTNYSSSSSSSTTSCCLSFKRRIQSCGVLHQFGCLNTTLHLRPKNPSLSVVANIQRQCSGPRFNPSTGNRPLIIDAEETAMKILSEIQSEVSWLEDEISLLPCLVVLCVGRDENDFSGFTNLAYKGTGMDVLISRFPTESTEEKVLMEISKLNDDYTVHGIVIDRPLPRHLKLEKMWNAINIEKDVEGNNPLHIGRLAMQVGEKPLFVPCTAMGCIELLHRHSISIKGKRAVVIGRSSRVGMPTALLLQREDATVTIIHSRTKNPEEITKQADIVISAAGEPNLVRGSWIKPGAAIIDVGRNTFYDIHSRGYTDEPAGDVCYDEAHEIVSAITTRAPMAMGEMADVLILFNTLLSFMRSLSILEDRGFTEKHLCYHIAHFE